MHSKKHEAAVVIVKSDMPHSQSADKRETKKQQEHSKLVDLVQEKSKKLNDMAATIDGGRARTQDQHATVRNNIASVTATTHSTQSAALDICNTNKLLADPLQTFSVENGETSSKMIRSNLANHEILLAVQRSIPTCPTALLTSNIKSTDALDTYYELPYEYLRHWIVRTTLSWTANKA